MIKLFIRVWVLVFLPLFYLIYITAYNPIHAVNDAARFEKITASFKGTFFLIEQHLKDIPESEWHQVFPSIANQFSYELALISSNDKIDYSGDLEQLLENEFVVYSDYSGSDAIVKRAFNSSWFIHMMLAETEEQRMSNLSQGTVQLLMQILQKTPQPEWQAKLDQLQPEFDFDLTLIERQSLDINAIKLAQLNRTGMTWLINEKNETEFYRVTENKNLVIKVGPIPVPGDTLMVFLVMIILFVTVVSLGILIFIFPLWKDLNKLSKTASLFGSGYLDQRAAIGRFSSIARLAKSFNTMAERIEKMVKSQRQLTNAIAHDLRTPLSRISFAFEMLDSSEASDDEKKRYKKSISSGITTLDYLINQILMLSRYSRATDITHFGHCVLAQQIRNEISLLQAEHSKIVFELAISPEIQDKSLFIDQRAILRALNNLISNALTYTNQTIRINFFQLDNEYRLSVEDDGDGIAEEDRDKVFVPFKQLDNEHREASKGHGLGLAIVQQIAEWHSGHALVNASSLGGARFEFCWPVKSDSN
ncbi:ATP-binding protein [Marinomonas colpomeniae]|uniref:histidine kinase n=1 Tax=Marinomonas colpomeniae TaxID=2774408 RepID=A0ABR8NWC8_9GAMM|nr:ATP-binding protein [Marinomonas colpomeniae]MBD5770360.1 ATP-binding protein [Marinomonas colpomeniae]